MNEEDIKKLKALGLNKNQAKVYLYLLEKEHATYRELGKFLEVTRVGIGKIVAELITKRFLKEYKAFGGKNVLMAENFETVSKKFLKEKQEELLNLEDVISEIDGKYGKEGIFIEKMEAKNFKEEMTKRAIRDTESYEFADLRGYLRKSGPSKSLMEKVKINLLYYFEEKTLSIGKRIGVDLEKEYAQIVCLKKQVAFSTKNREIIVIHNEQIANSIAEIIKQGITDKDLDKES